MSLLALAHITLPPYDVAITAVHHTAVNVFAPVTVTTTGVVRGPKLVASREPLSVT